MNAFRRRYNARPSNENNYDRLFDQKFSRVEFQVLRQSEPWVLPS